MATMLVTLSALSTPLAAQIDSDTTGQTASPRGGAFVLGLTGTVGQSWQLEAAEAGYSWRRPEGLIGAFSLSGRIGAFIDQGVILGGSRGFLFGASAALRSGTVKIAEVGDDLSLTTLGLDVTLEGTGYFASNSPLPQGSPWAGVALLPALRIGSGNGPRYAVMVGPTYFMGETSELRAMFALRVEMPLARGEPHP